MPAETAEPMPASVPDGAFDICHIANLARLALTDAEAEQYQRQLSGILGYIDTLSSYDLESAEPMAHPMPVFDVLRRDEARPGFSQEVALANAPKQVAGQFQIPSVLESKVTE